MTKGVVRIVRDFIGPARRPYLVVDTPDIMRGGGALGARGAAIQGLHPFASQTTYCLNLMGRVTWHWIRTSLESSPRIISDAEVLVYGFTFILVEPSGEASTWQRVSVSICPIFGSCIAAAGSVCRIRLLRRRCSTSSWRECLAARRIASSISTAWWRAWESFFRIALRATNMRPAFGDVIVRNPLTLEPVAAGEHGIVQVCSVLPTSFPGNLLLTEDMAQVIAYDGCPCGRRGISFRFAGRVPKAELRGCGNLETKRSADELNDDSFHDGVHSGGRFARGNLRRGGRNCVR